MPKFILAHTEAEYAAAQLLFVEYATWLKIDLCFQGFESELKSLQRMYGPPTGGLILLQKDIQYIGCVGVRKISETDCELKRMWVQPAYQKLGLGQILLGKALSLGRELGYKTMKLDTLQSMTGPITLYKKNGFKEIPAYYKNPNKVIYFELEL